MLLMLACGSMGCIAFGGEFSPERVKGANEEHNMLDEWSKKYIEDVLYIGMPVDEFVRLFTKDNSWAEPERPYIVSHDENSYMIIGRKKIKLRVAFKDGLLDKLEQHKWDMLPLVPVPLHYYADCSFLLKGHKYMDGLYKGMSEDEFLKNFSDKIIRKFDNCYVILRNGRRFVIEFKDKIVFDSWFSD